jgi:phosphoglycerol transferase MdoB-like AlkP superfamily enzyme
MEGRSAEAADGGAVTDTVRGRDQFALAALLAVICWLCCALLQAILYLRPAPHGGPFLLEWHRYFGLALYYDLLGVWLISIPFFALWLALYHRALNARWWFGLGALHAGLLTANLALTQIDHELLRFLGVRLNLSFLYAYAQPQMLSDDLFIDILRTDRGGPFVSVLLLLSVPAVYGWWAARLVSRRSRSVLRRTPPFWLAVVLALVPLAAPGNAWLSSTSQFRLRKVEPFVVTAVVDALGGFEVFKTPPDLNWLTADYQRDWLARSADPDWRFPDPQRPYLRVPVGAPPTPSAGPRWNVLMIQLETFRGADMGFLRPDRDHSPTPLLDRLVARPDAAMWPRTLSFGLPTINGMFAAHCSIAPPSASYITSYTSTELYCLPQLLRRHGYRAEMFNGGDTDWDNSGPWLRKWYDRLWRFPQADQRDREVFRAAAERIRELGRADAPFLATVVSVTNHTPFRSRDHAYDIAGHTTLAERILNTTHYTDDVVGEFLQELSKEPWFAHTLVVIYGDHGFNVGEHGQVPGQHNLYRESVWVPLIMAGAHPRLLAGRHDRLATQLDIVPTVTDLLGIREANPWQGHSLLQTKRTGAATFGFRSWLLAETEHWSAVLDPSDGRPRLYRAREDWLQQHDLSDRHPDVAQHLLQRADQARRLNEYLLRHGLIWQSLP